MKNFWLAKSEPDAIVGTLVADSITSWTGVRNFTARNNLRAMSKGDEVLFYHSVTEKAVVGIATVKRTAYPIRPRTRRLEHGRSCSKTKTRAPGHARRHPWKSRAKKHPAAAPVTIMGAAAAQGQLRPHCANGGKLNRISPSPPRHHDFGDPGSSSAFQSGLGRCVCSRYCSFDTRDRRENDRGIGATQRCNMFAAGCPKLSSRRHLLQQSKLQILLRELESRGHEIVIHGYFQRATAPRERNRARKIPDALLHR